MNEFTNVYLGRDTCREKGKSPRGHLYIYYYPEQKSPYPGDLNAAWTVLLSLATSLVQSPYTRLIKNPRLSLVNQ